MKEHEPYFQEIGKILWSIFPEDALSIKCSGCFYQDFHSSFFYWYLEDNSEHVFDWNKWPEELGDKIVTILKTLSGIQPYAQQPFNHFDVSIDNFGKFKFESNFVPRGDCVPRLLMKGLSDLTEEEAKANYYSIEKWAKHVKEFKSSS